MSNSPGRKDIVPHTPSHPHAPSSMLHHTLQHHLHGVQPVSPPPTHVHPMPNSQPPLSPSSSVFHVPSTHHLPSPSLERESFSLPHSLPVFPAQSNVHVAPPHQQQRGWPTGQSTSTTSPESSSDDMSLSSSRSGKDPKIAIIAENLRQKQQKQLHDMLHKGNVTVGPSSVERKAFRDTVRDFDRQKLWVGVLYFAKSATAFQCLMDDHPILRLSLRYRFPWCSRRLLHILKNARLRLSFLRSLGARPTPFELRADPILALFSDDHLLFASSCMKPVVFLAHEAVIFSGMQEPHCYFIRKGSVDLRLGCETIATVTAGSLFGVMEMLSSEKRATEVIARETVFCWKLAEESFSAYPLRDKDKMYHSAFAAICEQRQINLRRTHFGLLEPSFLQEFHGLRRWPQEALRRSMQRASPHVFRKGEIMICHSAERETDHCALLVMHGKVKFLLDHSKVDSNSRMLNGRTLAEMMALVCGLQPRRSKMASFLEFAEVDPLVAMDKEFDALFRSLAGQFDQHVSELKQEVGPDGNTFTVVGELAGPMVLNAATLILNEPTPFLIKASSMCDTMKFYPQEEVLEIAQDDREQLKRIRHEMLQVEGRFLPLLGRQQLCHAIIPKQICFSFLTKSFPYEAIPFVPIVMDYGHKCIFTASNDHSLSRGGDTTTDQQQDIFVTEGDLCLVLVSGKLEELSVGQSTGRRLSFRSLKRSQGDRRVSMDLDEQPAATGTGTAVRRVSYLWPDLSRAFFGVTSPLIAIATEKTVALQCRRSDLLDAFADNLNHNDLKTFVDAVVTSHRIAAGQTPSYTDCGSQLTDAKIRRVAKNRRNSFEVDLNAVAGVNNASAAKAMLAQSLIEGLEEDGTPQRNESLASSMSQLRFSMNSPQHQKRSFKDAPLLDPSIACAPTGPERGRYLRTHLLLSPRRESAAPSPSPQPEEPTLAGHDDLFEEIAVVAEAEDCGDLEVLSVGEEDENVSELTYRFGEAS